MIDKILSIYLHGMNIDTFHVEFYWFDILYNHYEDFVFVTNEKTLFSERLREDLRTLIASGEVIIKGNCIHSVSGSPDEFFLYDSKESQIKKIIKRYPANVATLAAIAHLLRTNGNEYAWDFLTPSNDFEIATPENVQHAQRFYGDMCNVKLLQAIKQRSQFVLSSPVRKERFLPVPCKNGVSWLESRKQARHYEEVTEYYRSRGEKPPFDVL